MDGQTPEQPIWQPEAAALDQKPEVSWQPPQPAEGITVTEMLDKAADGSGVDLNENPMASFTQPNGAEVVLPKDDGAIVPAATETTPQPVVEALQANQVEAAAPEVPEAPVVTPQIEAEPVTEEKEIEFEAAPEAEEVVDPEEVARDVEGLYSQAEGQLVKIEKAQEVLNSQETELKNQLAGIVESRHNLNASAKVIKDFLDRKANEKAEGLKGGLE
jgi:hypothetical protein